MLADSISLDQDRIRYRRILPAREAVGGRWPTWLPSEVQGALIRSGLASPWRHQTQAAEALFAGRHTVLTTGTASGKSLGYLLPILAATYGGPEARAPRPRVPGRSVQVGELRDQLLRPRRPHTALYLAPTKALAHDQLRSARALGLEDWRLAAVDGDSEPAEREWARDHASYLFTNPDLLHRSLLPQHERWSSFLAGLRYVVIDESHRYRGVFGAHVAAVLRRLRRICARYGSSPIFVLASATTTNAAASTAELIGCSESEVEVVSQDASPHGAVELLLWQPEGYPSDDAARLLAELVDSGRQSVAFIPSRRVAELVALRAREQLRSPARIESYRSGYLATDRRRLEHDLQTGAVNGVAATNALELGVDISGLDAVVISGFPGTRAALWQQAGRAGRRGTEALVVLIAAPNPLDAYLFEHPELMFDTPVEETVVHADNPYVLGPHLAAAAQELPLTGADVAWFGPTMPALVARLESQGVLRGRPTGWFWTRGERAVDSIDLRGGGRPVEIVETETGRVLGTVDPNAADGTVHAGAVYLHQGETYLVDELDHDAGEALVRMADPGYLTQPRGSWEVRITGERMSRPFGRGRLSFGDVEVRSQVLGYLRRDEITGKVWDETPLRMPEHTLRTTSVWWTLELATAPELLGLTPAQLAGAVHGAEHTAIGLLPLFAPCDRWDIGGLSTVLHPDTGLLTVFVHDGHPGGAGFAERGFAVADAWWRATLQRLRSCGCPAGCPSCVVSPKCGNANQHLDKAAAITLLAALLNQS